MEGGEAEYRDEDERVGCCLVEFLFYGAICGDIWWCVGDGEEGMCGFGYPC